MKALTVNGLIRPGEVVETQNALSIRRPQEKRLRLKGLRLLRIGKMKEAGFGKL